MTTHARTTSHFVPPEIIAERYRVDREIGRGGMAIVFQCTDNRDGSLVAVKVLRPELGSAVNHERFLREIEFASRLDHVQIPKVLDSGVISDLPFYVMSFIDGESLRARLDREKQLTVEEAIRITKEVISPMTYAHRVGIIHRDVKPANILLSQDRVYVLDFGVARAIVVSAGETLTSTGVAVGTPAYMSPEQAIADHDLDARSDIYSLACVTYEMIAGIPPFVGATPQAVMSRRFVAAAPPLSETRDAVPESVERAVAKALSRAPADRFQSAEQFGDALTAAPQSPSMAAVQSAFVKRRRRFVSIGAAAAIVIVAIGGLAAWSMLNRDHVARGRSAMESWNLDAGERELNAALAANPNDPAARLWKGQYLIVRRAPASAWSPLVLKAADSRQALQESDRSRVEALAAMADPGSSSRCEKLRAVAGRSEPLHADDFTAALTLADCLAGDRTVVADPASPTGYSFRSSFQEAANIYERVLRKAGSAAAAYGVIVPRLQSVLPTTQTFLRRGVLRGESELTFVGAPALVSDTIAFVPVLLGNGTSVLGDPIRFARLIDADLERLRNLGIEWTRVSPGDPDAQEMLSGVLESTAKLDGPGKSALESIRLARLAAGRATGASGYVQRMRLAVSNTRVLVKLSRFRDARVLADSVLSWRPPVVLTDSIAMKNDAMTSALCGLVGRMHMLMDIEARYAADYQVRLPSGEAKTLPGTLGADVLKLRAYSIFGAPRDSILSAYRRVDESLESTVPSGQLKDFRAAVMRRPLTMVIDVIGPGPLASLGPSADPFVRAVTALHSGNKRRAKELADSLMTIRSGSAPGALTMDVVFQDAWLHAALGDTAAAMTILDRALRGLSRSPSTFLSEPTLSAQLVRAMRYRADLATAMHDDATSRKWRAQADELWLTADPELKAGIAK